MIHVCEVCWLTALLVQRGSTAHGTISMHSRQDRGAATATEKETPIPRFSCKTMGLTLALALVLVGGV
jgi:hypothetical protein